MAWFLIIFGVLLYERILGSTHSDQISLKQLCYCKIIDVLIPILKIIM
ncbi:hypothetical protein GSD1FS_1217 [Bifidobacterium sp. GSD1FS]|uniref:Uncharacterized protein n=1 Tax=Bifidobacterium canis TaxID=2610880 RepID=A0A7K1J5E4_9BIFI|nr:hypothetical protein [Bifidobacterium canis]